MEEKAEPRVIVVESPGTDTGSTATPAAASYEMVRRRRRRRRRRRNNGDTPAMRAHLILLGIIGILLVFAVLGQDYRHRAMDSLRHLIPSFAVDLSRRLEVLALGLAALILIYLTPGVEEKVLGLLGIKRDQKHRRR